ncbi:hypothetical protein SCHPADRAFT_596821 [Schizopora paradoxa]|uniref:Uncharacterized protein n=1 Tax=Schizopora paradoxa TaxID=27342 RepID=A0A0H2RBD7_9AGAM|nr:hypothetical protein SCHPADRAFT_596821 [Schizopora paradoxa]
MMGGGLEAVTFAHGLATACLSKIFLRDSDRRASSVVAPCHGPDQSSSSPTHEDERMHASLIFPPIRNRNTCAVSPLCQAIVKRDLSLVQKHVSALPKLASTRHTLGFYPLVAALLSCDSAVVELLVTQAGIRPDCITAEYSGKIDDEVLRSEFSFNPSYALIPGATAMHYACMTNNSQMIEIICRISGDFLRLDSHGKIPGDYIDSSTDEGFEARSVYTTAQEQWERRFHLSGLITHDTMASAIFHKNTPLFESLLQSVGLGYRPPSAPPAPYTSDSQMQMMVPPPPPPKSTWTYLHVAVLNQYLPFIERIVEADPAVVNIQGSGFKDCKCFLRTHNLPYSYLDGATPLHLASLLGDFEIVDILLKAGANWDIRDYYGRTERDYFLIDHNEDEAIKLKEMFEEEGRRRQELIEDEEDEEYIKEMLEVWGDEEETHSNNDDSNDRDVEMEDVDRGDNDKVQGLDIEEVIGAKIIGQRGPIRSVASAIRLRKNGWDDPDKPLVMLFLGSSGVGKTELAKQIAMYIHGEGASDRTAGQVVTELENDSKFVRIDMSEYQLSHSVMNLYGSPKSYVGYEEGGCLTSKLLENPGAIVLLDEIEKAHPDVLTLFLQVFDDGRITDSKAGVVNCKDAIFIMTSNLASSHIKARSSMLRKFAEAGHEEYLRVIREFNREIHPILKHALKRDEFLGRINQIVVFLPLNEEEISIVINNELKVWKLRAKKQHGIELDWSAEVVDKLAKAYDVNYGVRSVINEVRRIAVQCVAEAQFSGVLKKNYLAYLTVEEKGGITLKSENRIGNVSSGSGCRYPLDNT